ncbi:class I SAM-dependent methyltransferase [Terriglobus albidus]|uniref:class I SAM-dependent methyltransferase n=1 Tax=Terriglobus albidus TaxID=1592106 RepID=UPI0021E05138|nr:class I SAM-dependent methyltransferase [Terriglobus albidus]
MTSASQLLSRRETVVCGLCGSSRNEQILDQDQHGLGLKTVICNSCGLLFLNPRPTADAYQAFYEGLYHKLYPSRLAFAGSSISQTTGEARVRSYLPYLDGEINLLEVGAGDGSFLFAMRQLLTTARASGLDLAPEEVNLCRQRALDVRLGTIETESSGAYTHIAAFHTLEHALDPLGMLRAMAARLVSGGLLFLEVPDIESNWHGLSMIHVAHPYMFSAHTLSQLLRTAGFEPLTVEQLQTEPFTHSLRAIARLAADPVTISYSAPDVKLTRDAIQRKVGNLQKQALLRTVRNTARALLPQRLIALLWRVRTYGFQATTGKGNPHTPGVHA